MGRKSIKIKVVDLDENYKSVIDDLFHLKSFKLPKVWLKFSQFEIQICQNDLGWQNNKNPKL
jgi:hypothetical protein